MLELPPGGPSFPKRSQSIATQCDAVLQAVLKAEKLGVVDAPATSLIDFSDEREGEIRKGELNSVRFYVVAKQLWLLGYLKDKPRRNISPSIQETEKFQSDLSRFQKDANITIDGWIGEETWKTLQELVSFESAINPSDWKTANGQYLPAFNRAIQLRQWAYGFVRSKPGYRFSGLKPKVAERVSILIQLLCDLPQEDWRATMLDADKMLAGATRTLLNPESIPKDQHEHIRCLLISIARVELWLLGLEVDIDNADDYSVQHFGVKKKRIRRGNRWVKVNASNRKLKNGLKAFWYDLVGQPSEAAKELCAEISVDLFQALQNPEQFSQETEAFNEPDFSQEAAKELCTTKKIDDGFRKYRSLGMKLWDGVNRVWRWIKKGIKKIACVANNLIRGFFRFATKSYLMIRTAFQAMASSMQQYMMHQIKGTEPHKVFIDKDCDYTVIAHPDFPSDSAVKAIRCFSQRFVFSNKIVGLIVSLLISAIQGVIGWARFLYVLVKNYREIAAAYRALKAVT